MGNPQYDYELAIIGGGSAGYAAARTAAGEGLKTVVIEGGEEVGGLCILRGCMPSKALLYAGEVAHLAGHAATWGVEVPTVQIDFPAVMARKNRLIQEFADDRREQLESHRFDFLRATARFVDSHTISLSDGSELNAARFLISTGSKVSPSPLSALSEIGYLTSDEALSLAALPKSLVVLGGGPVAVELAQFFARMKVEFTLVQRSQHLLKSFDVDAATALEKALREDGITLHTGTRLTGAARTPQGKAVEFEHEGKLVRVEAQEILFALGRLPNIQELGLEKAGVETTGGRIATDARMQTSVPHICAAGDCTGPYEIVHIAVQQGEIAAHNLAHPDSPREIDYRLLTEIVFTDPQVASVGLTEKRAKEQGVEYVTASYPFNDHGKSMIMEALNGFVKLLADPGTGEILGGACVGPLGGELIHEIMVAMHGRLTVHEFAALPHYHPTLAEIWTYPAEELARQIKH